MAFLLANGFERYDNLADLTPLREPGISSRFEGPWKDRPLVGKSVKRHALTIDEYLRWRDMDQTSEEVIPIYDEHGNVRREDDDQMDIAAYRGREAILWLIGGLLVFAFVVWLIVEKWG